MAVNNELSAVLVSYYDRSTALTFRTQLCQFKDGNELDDLDSGAPCWGYYSLQEKVIYQDKVFIGIKGKFIQAVGDLTAEVSIDSNKA